MNTNFQCEKRLKELNTHYSDLIRNTAFVSNMLLEKYSEFFPVFTDHSVNHSLQVIDFCNHMIGDQIDMLNEDEIYILLMACYLHDCGMGISGNDYKALYERVVNPEYLKLHPQASITEIIRNFHHEFSWQLVYKFADFFEIPTERHVHAIAQISRGHRKVDLFDELEYPSDYPLENGNRVCLPYLSALVRLADELDIASDRNVLVDYDEVSNNIEYRKHRAIRHMEIEEDSFVLSISATDDPALNNNIEKSLEKLQQTLDECIEIIEKRTSFAIHQKRIDVVYV